uniref:Uncharacterized protein n=1 Tax=Glossina brevipalpis TaxID=37001 RepID=A0A1A9W8T3_9MUSC
MKRSDFIQKLACCNFNCCERVIGMARFNDVFPRVNISLLSQLTFVKIGESSFVLIKTDFVSVACISSKSKSYLFGKHGDGGRIGDWIGVVNGKVDVVVVACENDDNDDNDGGDKDGVESDDAEVTDVVAVVLILVLLIVIVLVVMAIVDGNEILSQLFVSKEI